MGRIIAIDYGKRRCGIATTDPEKIIANGLTTVDTKELPSFLDNYILKENVETIIIGKPLQVTGKDSESMSFIRPFFKFLSNKYPQIPVEWADERYTSKMAFQTMIDSGISKSARQNKELVDKISATILLQSYLEMIRDKK